MFARTRMYMCYYITTNGQLFQSGRYLFLKANPLYRKNKIYIGAINQLQDIPLNAKTISKL